MFRCDSFETRTGAASDLHAEGGTGWGAWSSAWSKADPEYLAICGIQTNVEPFLGSDGDDTSLNGVKFSCYDD
ncbi:hypothetical protein DPMN_055261 [Dreissena polymorpha]|uniref:Uncharacterized protein n=1 Tax=Dreissena polymorpha TaxID=45954 RepID=A0A9D4CS11_DREPO|nr:hypothetical protein DPMN_055261 [Dreissena polymorpha]